MSEKANILLVEDDKNQAYILQHFLESRGYSIQWFDSMDIALNKAREIPPDLFLLDIMLKNETDGFELCRQIKRDAILKKIPVIMVTARTSVEDRISGLRLGADDYVTKPFRREELAARIEAIIRRKKYSESNERYRELMENTKDVVIFLDLYGRIEQVNRRAEQVLPQLKSNTVGLRFEELFDQRGVNSIRSSMEKVLNGVEVTQRIWRLRYSERGITTFEVSMSPIRQANRIISIGCLLRDITQQEKVEQDFRRNTMALRKEVQDTSAKLNEVQKQLVMSEKMAVVGQLAAGIAHELRNPLNIIGTSAYYLKRVIQSDDTKIQSHLEIIFQEIQRAQKIINNLLDFSRKSSEDRNATDINAIIKQTIALVEKELLINDISVDLKLGNIDRCYVNTDEMKQVFINLILNAKDAMSGGGRLAITTEMNNRERAIISFNDSGAGIPLINRDKIFDPFFTTREDSQGTGIGLAIVHSSIKRNHGTITVESEEGKGSSFIIELPTTPEG